MYDDLNIFFPFSILPLQDAIVLLAAAGIGSTYCRLLHLHSNFVHKYFVAR